MTHRIDVEALYAAFCAVAPHGMAPSIREIGPVWLGTPPRSQLSEYFEHPFILEAPDFVADALPHVSPRAVRDTTLTHLLVLLESVARVRAAQDGTRPSPSFDATMRELRRAQGRAIAHVSPGALELLETARLQADHALVETQRILGNAEGVSLAHYLTLTRQMVAPRLEPSLALAGSAESSSSKLLLLRQALECVWVARETELDAGAGRAGWRGGTAWAVSLAREARGRAMTTEERPTEPDLIARMVQESGILEAMLACASRLWDAAAHRANELGATRFALWARQRAQTCSCNASEASALCMTPTGSTGA